MGTQVTRHERTRGDVRLVCTEFGGTGDPVLLLHGLAGYAGEWSETAACLRHEHRVLAPDQRGHGDSERNPDDVSRDSYVLDAAMWIEELVGGRANVIGQSLGGDTAFLLAARRPDLVASLVVAEASPESDPEAASKVSTWLSKWKIPFPSEIAAIEFFGGSTSARTWAHGLERRGGGLWPRFDPAVMLASLRESHSSHWAEWSRIQCPVLLVRGEHSMSAGRIADMMGALPHSRVDVIANAGHDVHLEQPVAWCNAIRRFLAR